MPAPDALEISQKKLYLSIKSELALFEKKKRKEILSYERAFRRSLQAKARPYGRKDLFRALSSSRVILVGDFHPFRQSQKGFLRLVEECKAKGRKFSIGLECLQQAHQGAVNEFLAGLITLEELREKIDFERYWPFSWESYREVLRFAKSSKAPVIALNILERKRTSTMLRERDRAAAERIAEEIDRDHHRTVFVLYGELHLARPHLPSDLKQMLGKSAKVSVVHQNEPDLYWKAKKLKNGQKPEVLRLAADEFCILNSVPWVKLRSYLDWLEGNPTSDDGEEFDAAGTIHHYARLLSEAIGVRPTLKDDVEIFTPDRLSGGLSRSFLGRLSKADAALAAHSLRFQRTAYLPGTGVLLLPSTSTNSLSEAASWLLWHSLRKRQAPPPSPRPDQWIAHFLIGYLGSKVLNPKRKCNEVDDLKEISNPVSNRALALLRPYIKNERLRASPELRPAKEMEAARLAGYLLADRFFLSLLMKPDLLHFLRTWYECSSPSSVKTLLAETAANARSVSPSRKRDLF